MSHVSAPCPTVAAARRARGPAIELDQVWVRYGNGHHPALQDMSLSIPAGERWAIVGPSGSGKSTLLKLLKGLVHAEQGTVTTLGVHVNGKRPARRLRERIGYIPQNLGLVTSATVLDNALLGSLSRVREIPSWLGIFPRTEYARAMEALETTGLAALADRKAHELSGGERRRLAVARALVQRPEVLLADEFLSELDDGSAEKVLAGLDAAHRELGMTILMVEHDLRIAREFCDVVSVLDCGVKIAEGRREQLDEPTIRALICERCFA
jgi:phosphonate transport system ATP-binding protein